jgi:CheY-like chemotaxis protein
MIDMTTDTKALRIVIVEDESMVAMLLEDILGELGHNIVAVASSLEKAERMFEENEFDLAVLDVNLNGIYTYPLAAMLKEKGSRFLFSTGYGRSGLRPEWHEYPVLQKPFTDMDVRKAVEAAMSQHA